MAEVTQHGFSINVLYICKRGGELTAFSFLSSPSQNLVAIYAAEMILGPFDKCHDFSLLMFEY